jgi:hypothetical protein
MSFSFKTGGTSPKVGQVEDPEFVGGLVGVVGAVTGILGMFGTVVGGGVVLLLTIEATDTAAGKAISMFLLDESEPEAPGEGKVRFASFVELSLIVFLFKVRDVVFW